MAKNKQEGLPTHEQVQTPGKTFLRNKTKTFSNSFPLLRLQIPIGPSNNCSKVNHATRLCSRRRGDRRLGISLRIVLCRRWRRSSSRHPCTLALSFFLFLLVFIFPSIPVAPIQGVILTVIFILSAHPRGSN